MGEKTTNSQDNSSRRFSQEQYDMLKRCSDKKDMTEWNQWRENHPDEVIWLQGRSFNNWWLQKANFMHWKRCKSNTYTHFGEVHLEGTHFEWANLQKAIFAGAEMEDTRLWSAHAEGADFNGTKLMDAELGVAHFEGCDFSDSNLHNARFTPSWLNGTKFTKSDLRGCSMRACVVDGSTRFWECIINRHSKNERFTDLTGVPLDNVIIDPATKQLLEYNIRRMNWEEWYREHPKLKWVAKLFWLISDYGISEKRIIKVFLVLVFIFSLIYYLWGQIASPGILDNLFTDRNGDVVPGWIAPWRVLYFSIITMTLGFSDMYANAHSAWGHTLIALQAILGYVLLGALVTRFAVLFTAGGPAGKFADEKGWLEPLKNKFARMLDSCFRRNDKASTKGETDST